MPKSELSVWDVAKLLVDNITPETRILLTADLEHSASQCKEQCEKLLVLKLVEELEHQND